MALSTKNQIDPLSDRTKVSTHYWYVVQDTKGSRYWFTWFHLLNLVCYIVMNGYWNVLRVIVIKHILTDCGDVAAVR